MKTRKIKSTAEKGITLVALVITIVILIILATITINVAFGEGGLIEKAQQAKNLTEEATREEQESLNSLMSAYANIMAEEGENGTGGTTPEEPDEPEKSEVEIAKENGETFDETTTIEDEHGNKITVPEGFKIPEDSGDTVQEGIVIEDAFSEDENVRGSQYVWIPVGTFKKDDEDETESNEIVLGRYTFADDANGTPTLQQAAYTTENPENYTTSVIIENRYSEMSTYREGVASASNGKNATAYDLEAWINSVKENGGYYIGRYEASYASGSSTANYKAASKVSRSYSTSSMSNDPGTLWNNIIQIDASKVAINTYKDSTNGVKSDLINSYAWDTAIVYIQEAGYTNYANRFGESINSNLTNTGTGQDEVCKINDMASNEIEWTTEYCSGTIGGDYIPGVNRGGKYSMGRMVKTSFRQYCLMTGGDPVAGFRLTLYLEQK